MFFVSATFIKGVGMGQDNLMGGSLTVTPNGARLAALRRGLKLKQNQVEEQCGIKPMRLTQFENGKPISLDYLTALANFYDVEERELIVPESLRVLAGLGARIAQLLGGSLQFGGLIASSSPAAEPEPAATSPQLSLELNVPQQQQTGVI